VTLKLKFADFSLVTRSHSLDGPLLSSTEIARIAAVLLEGVDVGTGVRLLGVSVSGLERSDVAGGRQLSLVDLIEFDSPGPEDTRSRPSAPARAEVEAAVDAIRSRYGAAAVGPATVVDREKGLRVKELGDAQWG
jgi:DNA polymerase-4